MSNVQASASRYTPRLADDMLARNLHALGAVSIEGVKGCGKTATARQVARSFVSLDNDPAAAQAADLDPRLILAGDVPRLIDEWQFAPRVWDAVRHEVDDRQVPGQFILTGSATPVAGAVKHSGAGRFGTLRMRTMTLFEQGYSTGSVSLADLLDGTAPTPSRSELTLADYTTRIAIGGWPQLQDVDVGVAADFLAGYLAAIVDRDIDVVSGAQRNPELVRRFLVAYAQMTAHPSRLSTIIARAENDADTEPGAPARGTAEPYLAALRRMMIVDELPAWDPALRSSARLTGVPKRHLADPSLAAFLMNCGPARMLTNLNTFGFLFESLVTRDVRVYAESLGARTFHYRENSGRLEVDLVVERGDGTWTAFEVKLGGQNGIESAAASLLRLAQHRVAQPPTALVVITGDQYALPRPDGVWVVPLGCLGP